MAQQSASLLHEVYDPELAEDAIELHEALTELIRVYQFRDRDLICCYDLSVTGYYALDALIEHGAMTLNELAALLYLDKSSASRIVGGLERKGYAARRVHPADGRALQLEPTAQGRVVHGQIVAQTLAEQRQLLSDFDPEVRQAMAKLIARLARAAVSRVKDGRTGCCPAG